MTSWQVTGNINPINQMNNMSNMMNVLSSVLNTYDLLFFVPVAMIISYTGILVSLKTKKSQENSTKPVDDIDSLKKAFKKHQMIELRKSLGCLLIGIVVLIYLKRTEQMYNKFIYKLLLKIISHYIK